MYRQGLTTTQIAATAGAGQSTVRYHLALAAAEPSIRDDHRTATRRGLRRIGTR
jgi:DNA-binding CsgD family transcriptional regulator